MKSNQGEILHLNELYKGRKAYHGELHDHAATGGTSDGKTDLATWREDLKALNLDFAAILDHKQVRHMYLPEWEDGLFIGGTEPGTIINEVDENGKVIKKNKMHFNMVFAGPNPLEELLSEFEEFHFTGGPEGHFVYSEFSRKRFIEIIDSVKAHGGFFVHPHPKQVMVSDEPLDYWFEDETGIEIFYGDMANQDTRNNYELYKQLLALGKRVWCSAGGDGHNKASDKAISTIYAEQHKNSSYISHLREGDFICGSVGIRMCIGDTKMGGKCGFGGQKLTFCIDDFHSSVVFPDHEYHAELLDDKGVVLSAKVKCDEPSYFTVDVDDDRRFYRAEVFDDSRELRIAIGNPIWNEKYL